MYLPNGHSMCAWQKKEKIQKSYRFATRFTWKRISRQGRLGIFAVTQLRCPFFSCKGIAYFTSIEFRHIAVRVPYTHVIFGRVVERAERTGKKGPKLFFFLNLRFLQKWSCLQVKSCLSNASRLIPMHSLISLYASKGRKLCSCSFSALSNTCSFLLFFTNSLKSYDPSCNLAVFQMNNATLQIDTEYLESFPFGLDCMVECIGEIRKGQVYGKEKESGEHVGSTKKKRTGNLLVVGLFKSTDGS